MKKIIIAGLLLGMLLPASALTQYPWQNIGPGGGGELSSIAHHPTNSNIMYLASVAGAVFKSSDGGASWTNISNNLAHSEYGASVSQVNDIVIDSGSRTMRQAFEDQTHAFGAGKPAGGHQVVELDFAGGGKKLLGPLDPLATEIVIRSAAEHAAETGLQLPA